MPDYPYGVVVDKHYRFPPKILNALAADELNSVGFLRAVFIPTGGEIPPEAISPYILVIEQE